jgi:hypothetical protein
VRIYRQVNKVKKTIELDSKQADKVYNAYKKYTEAVEGTNSSNQGMPMGGPGGGRPMGGPGGGGPMGGGPGGGGQMGGPGGQMGGAPQGGNFGGAPQGGEMKRPSSEDMEKRKKTMEKQEKKLCKKMKKILNDDAKYAKWQELRQQQLMPPRPEGKPGQGQPGEFGPRPDNGAVPQGETVETTKE